MRAKRCSSHGPVSPMLARWWNHFFLLKSCRQLLSPSGRSELNSCSSLRTTRPNQLSSCLNENPHTWFRRLGVDVGAGAEFWFFCSPRKQTRSDTLAFGLLIWVDWARLASDMRCGWVRIRSQQPFSSLLVFFRLCNLELCVPYVDEILRNEAATALVRFSCVAISEI